MFPNSVHVDLLTEQNLLAISIAIALKGLACSSLQRPTKAESEHDWILALTLHTASHVNARKALNN